MNIGHVLVLNSDAIKETISEYLVVLTFSGPTPPFCSVRAVPLAVNQSIT